MDMSVAHYLEAQAAAAGLQSCDGVDKERGIMLRDCLTANYQRLHRRLYRQFGCPDHASDCLHDAWLKLGECTVSPALKNPEAYVYRVACNAGIDRLRSDGLWQYAHDGEDGLAQLADGAPGPDVAAEARSSLAAVSRAMESLPRLHLSILTALRVEELPRQEVAQRYGLSLRTVDTALRRALECCGQAV